MNDYFDTFDEVSFNLEWHRMIGLTGSEKFDMERFQCLAKNTYSFLAAFDNSESIAREYLGSIMLIHAFATLPPIFLNQEGKTAVRTINALLDFFIDDQLSCVYPYIIVDDEEGNLHSIDVRTFDLSSML